VYKQDYWVFRRLTGLGYIQRDTLVSFLIDSSGCDLFRMLCLLFTVYPVSAKSFQHSTIMALNSLYCADVPLSKYLLTHSLVSASFAASILKVQ